MTNVEYYAIYTDEDGFDALPHTYTPNSDGMMPIESVRKLLDIADAAFQGWAVDLQDFAVIVLRASGDYPGIGGRVKKTGEMLCSYCGDQKDKPNRDYLRLGLNGTVINPDEFPEAAKLIHDEIEKLAKRSPQVVKKLEYL